MLPAGRRSKIRPPRKSLVNSLLDNSNNVDPVVDYDKSWVTLSNAIAQIQNKNVSNLSYEQLYRKAYVLVLRKFAGKLYEDVSSVIAQHLLRRREVLLSITDGNEEFMKQVLLEWNEHLQAMKFVSDVLMYLNRVYVKEHKRLLIYDLGIQLFKDNIIKYNNNEVGDKLVQIVILEITRSRSGEVITSNMYITKLINMIELLVEGSNSELVYGENYYQNVFEPTFLATSETFFYRLSQDYVNTNLGSEYLKLAHQFIKEEESRASFYLPHLTHQKLIDLMNNILIKDKIDSIILLPLEKQGLSYWLLTLTNNIFNDENEPHHTHELQLLYELIGRIDQDYELLRLRLKDNIISQGQTIPEFVRSWLDSSKEKESTKKASTNSSAFALKWIDTIIEYQAQLLNVCKRSFEMNAQIEQTINHALRDFINANNRKVLSVNAPELLSVYMDHHIKQFNKATPSKDVSATSPDQSDVLINSSVKFLRLVKDKDSFEANYANHFAKRFLNTKGLQQIITSNNKLGIDLEELVISKLGEEMGTSSLDKVLKMNKDIKLSRDITLDWKRSLVSNGVEDLIELDLKICNVTDWPKSMTKDYQTPEDTESVIWSRELRPTIKAFEEYWFSGKKNNNKSLHWSPKFGSMDFRITYPSRTYEINMPTYAGIIMLLFAPKSSDTDGELVLAFDEKTHYTYLDIKELTGIPESDLKRHLQSIAVAPRLRLLVKQPMTKDVKDTDVFTLNEKFKSPSIKVKVLTVSASQSTSSKSRKPTETEEEAEEISNNILEGRKLEVTAAIVRIMKSRHELKHNELIEELIKQLANRFLPQILLIKLRIEDLIEKVYLTRDDEDRNLYRYVA